ncbi:MAG: CDP-alcohol phosphatidyltransferase family protein, partial [Polyangiales bacterium]
PAALTGAAALGLFVWAHRGRFTPAGGFGAANALTALRLFAIVAIPSACGHDPGLGAAALVLAIFALDGLDGFIARRNGLASTFGARFDMECDALLVLVCSLVLYLHGRLGSYVLVAGALRYLYVLALPLLPGSGEAPRSKLGRYAFSVLALSFVASLAGLPLHREVALGAVGLLCYSFARSVYWSLEAV